MLQNPFAIGINQVLMQIKMKTIITEQDYEIRVRHGKYEAVLWKCA